MSASIDQRIVEMQFNNRQFESGVSETLDSLGKLKNSLDVLGSGEALQNLSDIDTSGMKSFSDSVDTASNKFSALEEIAVGALRRIGEMAVNAGTNLVRNLTNQLVFDNINAGWDKYAQKTEAVQTIMAATREEFAAEGNQMEKVTEQLDKLNWFTDETSYSFIDMTSNIGKFTSVGVELEQATDAMMGISTWAAISGANVNQASHAMYNLSQAMGVGAVTLADWKSIENANMATAEFKQVAMDAAVEAKTLIKTTDGVYKTIQGHEVTVQNFREYLTKDQWLTNEVLMNTLSQYGSYATKLSDAQEELTINNKDYYGTTSKLLKDIDKYIDGTLDIQEVSNETKMSTSELIEIFDSLSSSEDDLGRRAFKAAQEAKTFKEAIDSVKDAASTTWMNIFEDVFGDYEHAKVLWTDLANALWDTFVGPLDTLETTVSEWASGGGNAFAIQGVINLWRAFSSVIGAVGQGLATLFPSVTTERLIELTRGFRNFTEMLKPSDETLQAITNTVKGLVAPLRLVFTVIGEVAKGALPLLAKAGSSVISTFVRITGTIGNVVSSLVDFIKESGVISNASRAIFTTLDSIFNAVKRFGSGIWQEIGEPVKRVVDSITRIFTSLKDKVLGFNLFEWLGEVTGNKGIFDKFKNINNIFAQGTDAILEYIHNNGLLRTVAENIASVFEKMAEALDKFDLKEKLTQLYNSIVTIFGNVKTYIAGVIENIKGYYAEVSSKITDFINAHEGIKNVIDWFKNLFETIKDTVSQYGILQIVVGAIGGVFYLAAQGIAKVYEFFKNSGFISKISAGLQNVFSRIKQVATYIYDKFSPYIASAINKVKEFFSNLSDFKITDIFKNFDKFKEAIKGPGDLLNKLKEIFTNLGNTIKDFFGKINPTEGIRNFITTLHTGFTKIAEAAKKLFENKSFVDIFKQILDIVYELVKLKAIYSLSQLGSSMSSFFDNLSGFFKRQNKQALSKSILEISAAIAVLAGSLWLIAQIPSEKLGGAVASIAGLFAMLAALAGGMVAVQHFLKMDLFKSGAGLLMMTFSIGLMVGIVKLITMSGIDFDTVKDNIESFIVIFGLIGVMLLATKLAGKNAMSGGAGILFMSISLGLIIGVIKEIAKVNDSDLNKGKKVVEELLVIFGVIMLFSKLSGKEASKVGSMLLKMSVALGIITICIAALGKMDPVGLHQGVKAMTELMVVFGIVGVLVGLASRSSGSIGGLAIVIAAITGALLVLGKYGNGKELEGAKALSLTLVALGVAFGLLGKVNTSFGKMLSTAITMGIILAEIVIALKILNEIDAKSARKNAITLSAVMVVLFEVFKQFAKITATTKKMRSTAITMAIVLESIAVALLILGKMNPKENLANAIVLSAVMVILVEVFKRFKPINASIGECVKTAIMMGVILGEIVIALHYLSQTDAVNNIINATALTELLAALSGAILILSKAKLSFGEAVTAVIAMGVILAEMVIALRWLKDIDAKNNLINATALSELALALSISIGIFSLIGAGGAIVGAIAAVAGAAIFLGGLTGIVNLLGIWGTAQKANIEAGIEMANKLAYGIGTFIGNIVTGIGDTIFGALPGYGENLSDFATNLQGFIETFSNAPEGVDTKVASVAKAILALTAANLVDNLANWLSKFTGGHSIVQFGEQLSSFGESFAGFINSLSGVSVDEGVKDAAAIAETMVALSKEIPNSGGLLGKIMGENDIDDFGKRLMKFGLYFAQFVGSLTNIEGDYSKAVEACHNATQMMIELATEIPNSGGLLAKIMGENDIDDFGKRLNNFATNFVSFVTKLTNIEGDYSGAVQACHDATQMMIELATQIPNSGTSLASIILGDNSIDDFGDRLNKFGTKFVSFVRSLTEGIRGNYTTAINACHAATQMMIELSTQIPNTGGLLSWIVGDNAIDDFGERLAKFGEGFAKFVNSIKDLPDVTSKSKSAVAAAGVIAEFAKTEVPESGGLFGFLFGSENGDLEGFGRALSSLGQGIGGYYDGIKDVDFDMVERSLNFFTELEKIAEIATHTELGTLQGLTSGMTTIAVTAVNAFINAFLGTGDSNTNTEGKITSMILTFIGYINTALTTYEATAKTYLDTFAKTLIDAFKTGIDNYESIVTTRMTELGETIIDTLDKALPASDFNDIGTRVVSDLEDGIDAEDDNLFTLVEDMATTVDETVSNILHSGVWYGVGAAAVQGLASGISDNIGSAVAAASAMAAAVSEAASVTLQVHSPSKVFMGIGFNVVRGFVRGMTDNEHLIAEAGEGTANTVINKFGNIANMISSAIDDSIDISPVITPVLDLSTLESDAGSIDSMFGTRNIGAYSVATPTNLSVQSDALNRLTVSMEDFINRAQNPEPSQINIYVTGGNEASAEDIANEVMYRLDREVQRKKAAFA